LPDCATLAVRLNKNPTTHATVSSKLFATRR
jgi:hypothetical protein